MPIYEYSCKACEHEFETLQRVRDAPLVDCPQCGAAELRKKVSVAAFRLKGGGWYETDFKSGDKKNLAGERSADKGSSGGSDAPSGNASSSTAEGAKSAASDTAKPAAKSSRDASTPNGKSSGAGTSGSKSPA